MSSMMRPCVLCHNGTWTYWKSESERPKAWWMTRAALPPTFCSGFSSKSLTPRLAQARTDQANSETAVWLRLPRASLANATSTRCSMLPPTLLPEGKLSQLGPELFQQLHAKLAPPKRVFLTTLTRVFVMLAALPQARAFRTAFLVRCCKSCPPHSQRGVTY